MSTLRLAALSLVMRIKHTKVKMKDILPMQFTAAISLFSLQENDQNNGVF